MFSDLVLIAQSDPTGLVAARTPRPHIAAEAPWTEIGPIARQLLDRAF